MNNRPYILVVLSAAQPHMDSVEALETTTKLMSLLSPLPCTMGTGFWEGAEELVVIAKVVNPEDLSYAIFCAKMFAQRAVLVVDTNDQAHLVYCDDRTPGEELGTWTEVQSGEGLSAWTRIGMRWFTTVRVALDAVKPGCDKTVVYPLVDAPPVKYERSIPLANEDDAVYAMHGIDDGPPGVA